MSFSGTLMSADSASDADHSDIENPCDVDDLSDIEKPSDVENLPDAAIHPDDADHMDATGGFSAYEGFVSDSDSRMWKLMQRQAWEEEDNRSTDSFTDMYGERRGPFYSETDVYDSVSDFYGDHHAGSPSLTDSEYYGGSSGSGYFDPPGRVGDDVPVQIIDDELPDGRVVTFDRNREDEVVPPGQTVYRDPDSDRRLAFDLESTWSLPSEDVSAVHVIKGREIHVLQRCITDVHHKVYHDVYDHILASSALDPDGLVVLKLNGELELFGLEDDARLEFMCRLRVEIPDGLHRQSFNRAINELLVPSVDRSTFAVCATMDSDMMSVRVYHRRWSGRRQSLEPGGVAILHSSSKVTLSGDYLWSLSKEGESVCLSVFKIPFQGKDVVKRLYSQNLSEIELSRNGKVPQLVALASSRRWKSLYDVIVLTAKPLLVCMEIRDGSAKAKLDTLQLQDEFKALPLSFDPERLCLRTTTKVLLLDNDSLTTSPITSLLDPGIMDNKWYVDGKNTAKPFPVSPQTHNMLVGTPTYATPTGKKEQGVFGPGLHGWGTTPIVVQRGTRLEIIQEALTLKCFGGLEISESDKWSPLAISRLIWVRKARLLFAVSDSKSVVFSFKRNTRRGFQSNLLYPRKIDGLDSIEVVTAGVVRTRGHTEDDILLIVGLHEVLAVSRKTLKVVERKSFDGAVTSAAVDSSGAYVILNGGQSLQSVGGRALSIKELRKGISPEAYCKTLRGEASLIFSERAIGVRNWLKKDLTKKESWTCISYAPILDCIWSSGPHRPMVELHGENTIYIQTGDFCPQYEFRQFVKIVGYVAQSTSNYYQGAVLLSEDRLWFASKDRMVPLAIPTHHGRVHTACVVKDTIIAVCDAGMMMYVPEYGVWSPTPMPIVSASVDLPDESTTKVEVDDVDNFNGNNDDDDDDDDDYYDCEFDPVRVHEILYGTWDEGDRPRRLLQVKSKNLILALRSGTHPVAYDFTTLKPLSVVGGTVKSRAAIVWEYSDRDGTEHEFLLMTARRGFDRYEIHRSGDNVELRAVPTSCQFENYCVPHHILAIGTHVIYGNDESAFVVDFSSGDGRVISDSVDLEIDLVPGWGEICWHLTHLWGEFVLVTSNTTIDIVKTDFDNSPTEFRSIRASPYFTYQFANPRRPDLAMDRAVRGEHEGIAYAVAAIDRGLFVVTIDTRAEPPDLSVSKVRFFKRPPYERRDRDQSFITRLRLCPPIQGSNTVRVLALRNDSSIIPFVFELGKSPAPRYPQPFFF